MHGDVEIADAASKVSNTLAEFVEGKARLLTFTNKDCDILNEGIRSKLLVNKCRPEDNCGMLYGHATDKHYNVRKGEPVVFLKNMKDLGIYNSMTGIVDGNVEDKKKKTTHIKVRFPVDVHEVLRSDVKLAYSLTVHKSQGIGTDHVHVVIGNSDEARRWHRNMLYTAVSRAKQSCTVYYYDMWGLLHLNCLRRHVRLTLVATS